MFRSCVSLSLAPCSADDFEASKSVLKNMGKNIVHCGDSGTGQVAKICNNLVLGISMAAVSEVRSSLSYGRVVLVA